MNPLLVQGGRIIDPSRGVDDIGSLLITEGKISWLGGKESPLPYPDYDALDAEGNYNGPVISKMLDDAVTSLFGIEDVDDCWRTILKP